MAPATIGSFHLGLGNVDYFERSFESVRAVSPTRLAGQ
jgi:hypothetical protein